MSGTFTNEIGTFEKCRKPLTFATTMEVESVGTFPLILIKLPKSPLQYWIIKNFEQNGWNETFYSLVGSGERDEHKVDQKIVMIRSRVLWKGFFYSWANSFDLYCNVTIRGSVAERLERWTKRPRVQFSLWPLATLGTRGFSRVRREFSVLAEGRHISGRRPKPRAATETGNSARKVSGTQGNR